MRASLFATAFVTLSVLAGSAAAEPFAVLGGKGVKIKSDSEACENQALRWCGQLATGGETLDRATVERLSERLNKRFVYRFKADDAWRSSLARVEADKAWRDDCGGMTFTTTDALLQAGQPADKVWRVIVIAETRKANAKEPPVKHMVAVAEIEGQYLVVGDTNNPRPYLLSQADFVPMYVSAATEGTVWRRTSRDAPKIAQNTLTAPE